LAKQAVLAEEERQLQEAINQTRARPTPESDEADDEESNDQSSQASASSAAEKAYAEFLAKVRKENKEQASLMNVEPLALKQVQDLLDPGVTLLEYFVAPDSVILWIIDKDRIVSASVPLSRRQLQSRVTVFREAIQQFKSNDFKQIAGDLYLQLIQPALPNIRGKELLIIPHDVLHYLPFQALLSPQGKYLIEDYPINYLSSASLMQFTKEKKRASREKALVMGNPSLGDPAYNLRFAEREAREIAQIYPKSAMYLRDEASKSKAISLSPNYDMLHFAVHAEFSEGDPLSSALLLAGEERDDGRLKVGEIFSLNLKSDLVVLSACETGLGKISSGDEIIGLTRAFIYAGTPSVVTTLWKVNDRASYELMREFYSNLKTMKKSEALRQAQLKTMKAFPEPFFWAAYGLTGEP
jgi:CHAT domain-containing protein